MLHLRTALAALALAAAIPAPAQRAAAKPPAKSKGLRIYFIDVEGGQSTLFVAPAGQSLLIDTGWPGDRDAGRIVAAAHAAGLTKIDSVLITHYHTDHVGGVPALIAKIPIGRFLDHGPNTEHDHAITEKGYALYIQTADEKHIPHQTLHPGQTLDALPGVHIDVVSGNGDVIPTPLPQPGSIERKIGLNPYCASSPQKPAENSENDRSLGLLLSFGQTRILDLGDLTWAVERGLVCPSNKLGPVDIYIASHHGFDRSGSPALVDAIAPRLAVIDNGGHKGADANAWQILASSPRMKDRNTLWQLHTAEAANAHNVDPARIANLTSTPDPGYGLQLSVSPSGVLSLTSERTSATVRYPSK